MNAGEQYSRKKKTHYLNKRALSPRHRTLPACESQVTTTMFSSAPIDAKPQAFFIGFSTKCLTHSASKALFWLNLRGGTERGSLRRKEGGKRHWIKWRQ